MVEQRVLVGERSALDARATENCCDLLVATTRAKQAAVLRVAAARASRLVEELIPGEQRGAERSAGVAGGRLDPDRARTVPRGAAGRWRRSSAPRRRPAPGSSAPVRRYSSRPMRSTTSSVTAWMLAARSMCRCVRSDSGRAGRPAEQRVEPGARHRQPLAVVEVVHVQPEAAVGLQVDQMLVDRIPVDGPAVRRKAHQLVFAAVDLEPAVVGERRVQQAERVRKREVVGQRDAVAAPDAMVVVLHSPTPSSVRMAASSNGLGKNALAAWLS